MSNTTRLSDHEFGHATTIGAHEEVDNDVVETKPKKKVVTADTEGVETK